MGININNISNLFMSINKMSDILLKRKGKLTMTNSVEKNVYTLAPAVDIVENKSSYVVKLDIPGAVKDKIKAQIEENSLVVTADVADFTQNENADIAKQYHREFSLANDIDLNSIDAKYELGVLTVTLNKKPQFLPKEITIN